MSFSERWKEINPRSGRRGLGKMRNYTDFLGTWDKSYGPKRSGFSAREDQLRVRTRTEREGGKEENYLRRAAGRFPIGMVFINEFGGKGRKGDLPKEAQILAPLITDASFKRGKVFTRFMVKNTGTKGKKTRRGGVVASIRKSRSESLSLGIRLIWD